MRYALLLLVVVAACAHQKTPETVVETREQTPKEVTIATRGAIEQWRQANEVRSIEALEKLYSHDPDIVLVNDGVTTVTEYGSLTLVFRKDPNAGWLIVGEHYSYKRPG